MGRRDKIIGADHVGAKLRSMRHGKSVSLTQMATSSGYSKSYLSGVENGTNKPSQELVMAYERVLGLKQSELSGILNKAVNVSNSIVNDDSKKIALIGSESVTSLAMSRDTDQIKEPGTNMGRVQRIPFNEERLHKPDYFVGRSEDMAWLLRRLKSGGVASIAALRGLGGIGKTSLAAIGVQKLREEGYFPDGIVVVNCENLKEVTEVLHQVLSCFDPQYRESAISDFVDPWEVSHHLLDGKKVLIVLDDIQLELAIEQILAPLRAAGVTLLLTSRHMLPHAAVPIDATRTLGLLSWREALELFTHSLGRKDVESLSATELGAAERIIRALDRHTLAVKLSGVHAAYHHRDLETLADALESPQGAFELPEDEMPQAVKRVFRRSLEVLPEEARLLFTALGCFATTDFSRNAAIALAEGLSLPIPEAHVNILVLRSLVDAFVNDDMPRRTSDRERLRLHPLLRALAVTELENWSEEKRHAALHTLASYYAVYASRLQILDPDGTTVALHPDITNITCSLEWAHKHGLDELVVAICSTMQYFWSYRAYTDESLFYLPWGIDAAKAISERSGKPADFLCLAKLALSYGNVLQLTSGADIGQSHESLEKAKYYYEQSLEIARKIQDRQTEGVALYYSGRLARKLGDLKRAESLYNKALPILQEVKNQRDAGWTLAFLGQIREDRGDLEEAEQLYKEALSIHRKVGHRRGEGWSIGYLGRLAFTCGRIEEAKKYYQQYLVIAEELQDLRSRGVCNSFLGEIALAEESYDEAEESLQEALGIMYKVHDPQSEGWISNLLGQVALARNEYSKAESYLQEALTTLHAVNDLRGESLVRAQLARLAEIQGDLDSSERLYYESLSMCNKLKDIRIIATTRLELGRFLIQQRGNRDEGCSLLTSAMQYYTRSKWPGKEETLETARRLVCECQ